MYFKKLKYVLQKKPATNDLGSVLCGAGLSAAIAQKLRLRLYCISIVQDLLKNSLWFDSWITEILHSSVKNPVISEPYI